MTGHLNRDRSCPQCHGTGHTLTDTNDDQPPQATQCPCTTGATEAR